MRHLRLIQLEDRRVLNASLAVGAGIELTGGEELLVQNGGTGDLGGGDVQTVDLTISNGTWTVDTGIDASLYDMLDEGKTLRVDQSLIDDGGAALNASGQLLIQGSDAATDDVTIDVYGLDFIPSGGIVFEGGEDPADNDNDSLTVTGYSLTTADGVADVTVTHTGAESGSVDLDGIGTIEFAEIEPLTLGGTAADLVITLPTGADDNVVLGDDANPDDGVSQIASPTNGSFETTTFRNPTNSLTVLDGSGVKTINIQSLDSTYSSSLQVEADSISVYGDISASGSSFVSLTADENILMHSGSSISVVDGNVTLTANQGAVISAGDFVGIRMQSNTEIVTTGTGNILLAGRGGDDAAATFQVGIHLADDANIRSESGAADAGTISLTGTGGIGASSDQTGIFVSAATISSVSGDIRLEGTGGTGMDGFDNGVYLVGGAVVESTGTGISAATITITGTGGNGTFLNLGVGIVGGSVVRSMDGDIAITGVGGTGTGDLNIGVALYDSAVVQSEGTATVTIMGTGAGQGTSKENHGVSVSASSRIVTETGDIGITGVAGNGASHGVLVDELDPQIPGAFVPLAGHVLSTGTAEITVTATGSGGADDFRAGSDAVIGGPDSTGHLTFNIDSISIDGSVSIESDGELRITPRTASTTIGIGGGSGTLNLNDTELALLADGFSLITIGDAAAGTGDVDIDSSTFTDSVHIVGGAISVTELNATGNTVSLTARTGAITDGGDTGTDVTADAAAFRAATGIGATNALETALMTVAFSNSDSGQVRISDTVGSLTIDDVDGLTSSTLAAGGTIGSTGALSIDHSVTDSGSGLTTFTSGSDLDINATVSTSAADLKFSADGNLSVDAAVGSGDGNVLITATGNVTQTAAVTGSGLALMVDGTTQLDSAGNNVTEFAAVNGDQTVYRDSDSVTVTEITVDSMTVTGASTTSGDMQVTTDEGSLTVAESVTATDGNVLLTSGDSSAAGDDLTVNSGTSVKSETGNVTLRGGDDVTVASGSIVDAADTVTIAGDFGNADDAGSTIDVQGTVKSANTAQISGEADNDVITLDPDAGSSGDTALKGQGGDDSYNVQLGQLGGTVAVDDQSAEGTDDLTITDDAGVAETFTVGATQTTTTTGSETVTYTANLEQVNVEGEDEADTFDVTASSTAAIDVKGGDPTSPASPGDQITFTTPASQTATLTQDGADGGTLATTGGFEDVTFDEIETLHLSGSVSITGTSGDDLVVLTATSANSGTLQITSDGVAGPVIQLTDVTDFNFDGLGGDDILRIVNPAGGVFNPADGITFDGGTGGEGNMPGSGDNPTGDALEIIGGSATSVEHVFVSNSEGSVFYDGEAVATISYEGLEPVTDTVTATTRTFTFTGGAETIDLANDAGAGQMTIDSTLGESVTFANPTGQLTINAGTGDDIININSVDPAYRAALTVNGDSHTATGDTVNLGTDLTLGSAGSTGDLLIDAEAIVLTSNVVIDTTDGGSNGNVRFTGTLNADAAAANRALQVTAGTGTVDFQSAIGATEALESLTVVSASTVDLPSVMTRDGGISITAGTINLNGTLYDTTDETSAGAVTFNGTTVLNANVMVDTDTSTDANVTFNGLVRADHITNDRTLDVTAGTGIVEFTDQIGNGHNLADLDIAASTIIFGGNVAVDAFSAGADGVITLDGDVELQNSLVNIDLDDGSVATAAYSLVITGNLNADNAANDRRFSVSARGGTIDFQGQIGNTQAIDDLDVTDNNAPTTIRFGGDVTVDGATGNHIVLLDGNVVVDNDVTFHLDGAVDKTLTVTGTFDADAAASTRAVVIRTGTADINVTGAVGAAEQLGSLTIANAANATFDSTVAAGSLTQTTGTGTTTFNGGTIGGNLDVSTANVTFASGTMAVSGTATVTATTAIAGGTDDGVADLTATVITLSTGTGGIGTGTTSLDLSASTRLDASTTAAGADYFIDGIGALKLGQVNAGTGTAVLSATTGIEDARVGEGPGDENIIASATALRAATGIGSADDIDTAVSTLAFMNSTSGQVHIINTGGLTINDVDGIMTSMSIGGGSITATSPLTISHDVNVSADMDFAAGDSSSVNDDLTIDTGATVTLDSATDATLKFIAGDDVILHSDATPRIVTTGAAHTVRITADNEGALDADRGSITQTGTDVTIARTTGTVDLHAQAFDGIGSPATPLRTTVDTITASTTGTGPISIVETDAVTLTDVNTADGTIHVTAGGQITATDVDAGGAGDVTLMTSSGDVILDSVSATGDAITIISAAAIEEAGAGDVGVDLSAMDIRLVASSGIGTTGTIEIDADNLAALTVVGDIRLSDVDGLTITTIDSTVGLQIIDAAASDDIQLTAGGTLTVNSIVSNAGAGNIDLTGDTVAQNADISANSTGTIDVTADDGSITMADGTTTTSGTGAITYDATETVALSLLTSTSGQLNVTADSDLDGSGSITDNTAGEAANLVTSTTAVLSAAEGIGGTGDSDLDTTIATLQATNSTSGDIIVHETSGLTVGGTGVSNSGGHIKLTVSSGDLDIDADVTAHGNTVFLAVAGNMTQQMNDDITADSLALMVDGTTRLDNAGNNVTNFAAMNGGQTVYRDADTLNIEEITVDGMTVTGIKTTNDDVKLIVDAGNLDIDESIALGSGNLFLDVAGNVTQQSADNITAAGLALMVDGTTRLDNAGNNVTNFAAMNGGQTVYRDADTLNIEEITVDGMTVTGIKTTNDDVKLIVDAGNLDIDESIALGSGNLFLDVAGNVTQQPGDNITAAGLGLMVDGATVLDNPGNNVITLAADNGGAITWRDADTVTVETVTVDGMTVTGITTTSDDVTLNVLAGNLNINEAITTQGGSLTANAAAAINSGSNGTITTTGTVADQDSGSVQLTAGTDVALAGAVDTSGFDNAAGAQNSDGGSVTITATTGSLAVDDITSSGGDVAAGTGGNAGLITLDAATTITLNDNPTVTDPADGDLSSAGGTDLSTGVRTGDGADLIFQDPVILAANEPTDGETQTINTSGATAGDVVFQQTLDGATPSANDLTISARDTDVSSAADPTSGDVTFMMEVGGTTRLGDLTITDADNVHAMQRIRATSLTQLAGIGNTTLNDVDIETVTAGPSSALDITTDYTINLRGNVSVTDATGTVDNTTATGETIAITSVDGNVIIEDGVVVSTDEDPAPGHSSEFTGDSIRITADVPDDPGDLASTTARRSYSAAERDSDADGITDDVDPDLDGDGIPDIDPADENVPVKGLFKAGPDTELRTDGGVAKRFPPLLEPTGLISATTLNETDDQVFFRSEWEVETGVEGEENLRVNVDWRDPIDEPDTFPDTVSGNPVTSQRQQTFLVRDDPNGANPDKETFGHVYSNLDSVEFVSAEVPEYEVDFSVAHHESIVVMGSHLDQSPLTDPQTVPSGVITTTDDPATGTGVADPATDVTDPIDSNLDLHFEFGLLEVKIPTEIGFVPPADVERPVPAPEPAAVAPLPEAAIQQFVPDEITDSATSSYSSQSEDYFQLRQNSTDPVEGFERIDPDVGWKLLQPRRLKEWVYANDLDGSGYELWLITTKIKDGQDITFERPVLRFDVFDNQPFPGAEELLDQLPELKLKRLEFNEDGSLSEPAEEADEDEATDNAETGARLDARPANSSGSDRQTDPDNSSDKPADGVARSAITGLAVTAALTRTRKYSRLSGHLSAVSRILNQNGG